MQTHPQDIKDGIIYHVLSYIENREKDHKIKALNLLNVYSDFYHINKKRMAKIDLKHALMGFIKNGQGYSVSVNILISAL